MRKLEKSGSKKVARSDSGLSDNTRRQYNRTFNANVRTSSIAALTLREVNRVGVLEAWLQDVADNHGAGSAKSARTVVSSIFGKAVRLHVLELNAMRETRPGKPNTPRAKTARDSTRAFTREQRDGLRTFVDGNERALRHDLADLIHFMAGTGPRVSEALALLWADLDLEAGTVHFRGTKTESSDRIVSMPAWLIERLQQRADRIETNGLVFPSPSLTVPELRNRRGGHATDWHKQRDRDNVLHHIRSILDEAGFPWATSYTFRRTVVTLIVESGLPVNQASVVVGHADVSMTQRHYVGRNRYDTSKAASVL